MSEFESKEFESNENLLSDSDLDEVAGGRGAKHHWYRVKCNVQSGYLALRRKPAFKRENEIDQIWPGETFKVRKDKTDGAYIWSRYDGQEGWTNKNYIKYI